MARASVELIVEVAKAVNPLRQVEQRSKKVDAALKRNQKAARDVEAAFQKMGRKGIRSLRDLETNAAKLGKRMGGLRGTIAKVAIGFAAFSAAQAGIARAESERRIKLLAASYGEVSELQAAAAAAADKFKLSQTEANQAIGNAFARLRPLGVSLDDITSTFGGFRTAAVLGGATAAEASAAFTQLSQALGSGALRGDEFRSVAEQAPLVLQAISDETGIAAGQLKEYAAEGLLTSDIVIKALKRIESEGAGKLAEALDGPAAKIKEFQNATEDVQVALTETVVPELAKSFVILAQIINDLKPVIEAVGSFAAKVLGGISETIQRIRDPGKLAAEQQAFFAEGRMRAGMGSGQRGLANLPADYAEQEAALFAAAAKPVATTKPKPTSIITLPPKGKSEKERVDMSEKMLNLLRERIELSKGENKVAIALKENEMRMLEIQESSLLPREKIAAQLKSEEMLHNDLRGIHGENLQLFVNQKKAAEQLGKTVAEDYLKRLEDAARPINQLYEQIGSSITTGIVDSLSAAVEGTKALADVAADTLRNIASILLQFGVSTALGGIPGLSAFFGGGRAKGGTVTGGRSYMVGEKGPELFTPGRTGSIAPSGSFGETNVVVNVDASGSQAQGNQPNAKALGAAIGAAVQAELVKQKRPGGLLA